MIELSEVEAIVNDLHRRVTNLEGEPIVSKNGAAACEAGGKYQFTDIADAMREINKVQDHLKQKMVAMCGISDPTICPDPWHDLVPTITKCFTGTLTGLSGWWFNSDKVRVHILARDRMSAIVAWNRGVTKYKALAEEAKQVADDLRSTSVRLEKENTMFRNQADRKGDMRDKLQYKLDHEVARANSWEKTAKQLQDKLSTRSFWLCQDHLYIGQEVMVEEHGALKHIPEVKFEHFVSYPLGHTAKFWVRK